MYVSMLFGFSYVFWLIGVSSNISVYYGVVSLVCTAGTGCVVLAWKGGSFLALVLFLIYLGGMLVIFAYSITLVMEPFPEVMGDWVGVMHAGKYVVLAVVFVLVGWGWWGVGECGDGVVDAGGLSIVRVDSSGLSLLYAIGGGALMMAMFGLFLTFFIVLVLVQGLFRVACPTI
uniref:NADH-ubiquinone oxidoreductase chain 6 n=1 Tax=Pelomedusa subrufa TaxID=44522 RepID=NU6M_PELSU|nr:NADH dehydrogenase subunit 6 [Pelomedusa subrufa]O79679.1 RecName: Full=NADH-ubiquinone oxidoreductase chain 6; AltName: Full=NADH dehydrogenase subunit 6 [Pelomedusa subrufa]AAD05059.1 NADH dehydrogenase subunit 6 [Pelomedusa subrufa]